MWKMLRPEIRFWSEPSRRNIFTLPSYLLERKPYSLLAISWKRHFVISAGKILAIMTKKKKRLLCCNAKTSWLEFCGVGLLFQCQEVGMSHKRARSSLKKREILFKTTTKLFQSSVERRTWCDNCICKTEISVWTWEFQSLILTKPWRGGLARIHRRSPQAPLMQHFRTSNCFTQSLAWIRWDGKWSSEVEIKTKLAPLLSDVTACLPRNWKVTAPPVF